MLIGQNVIGQTFRDRLYPKRELNPRCVNLIEALIAAGAYLLRQLAEDQLLDPCRAVLGPISVLGHRLVHGTESRLLRPRN